MIYKLSLSKKGSKKKSLINFIRGENDESQGFSLDLNEGELERLREKVSSELKINNSEVLFGYLFTDFPVGVTFYGRFNPADVISSVTREGYSIIKSRLSYK